MIYYSKMVTKSNKYYSLEEKNKMKKIVLAILFVLSLLCLPALAAESTNYEVTEIKVDDIEVTGATIYVEEGATIMVEVYLLGLGETQDVNVKTWLGGYEYSTVQATSSMFDIEDGVSYKKTLNLALPNDMNSEDEYTLYVEVYDDDDYVREEMSLMVSNVRHDVRVQDILVDNSVEAGDYASVTVRLENQGDNKEEDIKVGVTSTELGVDVSTYLDELYTLPEIDNEDEESSGDVTLNFKVDSEALSGEYTLDVTVTYNNGYSSVSDTVTLSVEGAEADEGEVNVEITDGESDEETKDFSTALKLGFGILAVLIVILALILIVRR
jgi:uncharacterized membrane protein